MRGNVENSEDVASKCCKFCFGTEEDDSQMSFVHPCKCRGSIHWVHNACLDMWFARANSLQQVMCIQCQTRYQKTLTLKPWRKWAIPDLDMDRWTVAEMLVDILLTSRMLRQLKAMLNGTSGVLTSLSYFAFWKCFVMPSTRFYYYGTLFLKLASSIFSVTIEDYDETREVGRGVRLPSDTNWEEISQALARRN